MGGGLPPGNLRHQRVEREGKRAEPRDLEGERSGSAASAEIGCERFVDRVAHREMAVEP